MAKKLASKPTPQKSAQSKSKTGRKKPSESTGTKAASSLELAQLVPDKRLIAPKHGVVVRMYRQGLGDCFLLAFGGTKGTQSDTKYVLIDCGVLNKQADGVQRLALVMENIVQATGGRIDVLVATHEHADHLSGFLIKGNPFLSKRMRVKQVWLGWTEKVGDTLADTLRKKHGIAQRILKQAAEEVLRRTGHQTGFAQRLSDLVDFEQTPDNLMSHEELKACLTDTELIMAIDRDQAAPAGIEGGVSLTSDAAVLSKRPTIQLVIQILKNLVGEENVKYCHPGEKLKIDGISAARVHVLGPPHVQELIKKDLPSANKEKHEVYMSAASANTAFALSPVLAKSKKKPAEAPPRGELDLPEDELPDDARHPFEWARQIPVTFNAQNDGFEYLAPQADRRQPSAETLNLFKRIYFDPKRNWKRIDSDWLNVAEQMALNLDSDTNNTSLALAFEMGDAGEVLLFPGDAQVGNWLSWRNQKYLDSKGHQTITIHDLFERTVLYKVGHHGSHNATLKRDSGTNENPQVVPFGLELMDDIIAMLPVDFETAKKSQWRMPHKPLYEALRQRSRNRVLRADESSAPLKLDAKDQDIVPTETKFKPVPGRKNAKWRCSEQTFSAVHRMYFEVEFRR